MSQLVFSREGSSDPEHGDDVGLEFVVVKLAAGHRTWQMSLRLWRHLENLRWNVNSYTAKHLSKEVTVRQALHLSLN